METAAARLANGDPAADAPYGRGARPPGSCSAAAISNAPCTGRGARHAWTRCSTSARPLRSVRVARSGAGIGSRALLLSRLERARARRADQRPRLRWPRPAWSASCGPSGGWPGGASRTTGSSSTGRSTGVVDPDPDAPERLEYAGGWSDVRTSGANAEHAAALGAVQHKPTPGQRKHMKRAALYEPPAHKHQAAGDGRPAKHASRLSPQGAARRAATWSQVDDDAEAESSRGELRLTLARLPPRRAPVWSSWPVPLAVLRDRADRAHRPCDRTRPAGRDHGPQRQRARRPVLRDAARRATAGHGPPPRRSRPTRIGVLRQGIAGLRQRRDAARRRSPRGRS